MKKFTGRRGGKHISNKTGLHLARGTVNSTSVLKEKTIKPFITDESGLLSAKHNSTRPMRKSRATNLLSRTSYFSGRGSSKEGTDILTGNYQQKRIKVINYSVLPDLGLINHVVFDKTDTLTMSSMKIMRISTSEKLYEIENELEIREMLDNFYKNPEEYDFNETLDADKEREHSNYSEKTQEYFDEIMGKYHPLILRENSFESVGNYIMPAYNLARTGSDDHLAEISPSSRGISEVYSPNYKSRRNIESRSSNFKLGSVFKGGNSYKQGSSKDNDSLHNLNQLEKQFKRDI